MKSMRSRSKPDSAKREWFSVSVAGWILSLLTLLLGTVLPTIYARLTFDGISVGKIDVARYSVVRSQAGMSFSVRIANTTKGAVAVESIETNFPKLLKTLGPRLTHQEAWIESSSEDANGENLPIIIPPETAKSIEFKQYYHLENIPTVSPASSPAEQEKLAKTAFKDALTREGLSVGLVLNGKLTALEIRTSSEYVKEFVAPPPPPPPAAPSRPTALQSP